MNQTKMVGIQNLTAFNVYLHLYAIKLRVGVQFHQMNLKMQRKHWNLILQEVHEELNLNSVNNNAFS